MILTFTVAVEMCIRDSGMGAMLDLILLGWIENPLILFFAGMVVTCSLEYFVSWLLETLFHKRWWDYTGWPGNINGRVCLIGGIAFGTFTVALIKLIAPVTIDMIDSVSLPALHIMTCVIAFVMIADTVKTVKCMDSVSYTHLAIKLGFRDQALVALIIMLGSPTTPSSYIMAKNMGHEGVLTSSVVVATTLM